MKYAILVAVLLLSVSSAHAREWDGSGAYTGVSLSQLKYKEWDGDFSISDSASAYRLFGGYRFRLRLEHEWFDTDSNVDASTLGLGVMFRF
jgi:hypothetical protein